jgi:hypothetical protein
MHARCKHDIIIAAGCKHVKSLFGGCKQFGTISQMADVPEEVRQYFRELAERGKFPQKGGKARARKLTAEQRHLIAKRAAAARWKAKQDESESTPAKARAKRKKNAS